LNRIISSVVFVVVLMLFAGIALAGQDGAGGNGSPQAKKYNIRGKPVDRHAVEMLLDESEVDGSVEMGYDGKTVKELRGRFKLDTGKLAEEAAVDFIDRHRNAFGLKNPKAELKLIEKNKIKEGLTYIHYQQALNGVPLYGNIVSVVLDKDNTIKRIGSGNIPTPDIDTTPLITAEKAIEISRSNLPERLGGKIDSPQTELVLYSDLPIPLLVYRVEFLVKYGARWQFFINAKDGKVIKKADITNY